MNAPNERNASQKEADAIRLEYRRIADTLIMERIAEVRREISALQEKGASHQ